MKKCFLSLVLLSSLAINAPLIPTANAQQLALSVNGDPITGYDIAQRMKLLALLKRSASREAAQESLIADSLKLHEMAKYGMSVSDSDILRQGATEAAKAKIQPQALGMMLQNAGVQESHWKSHFKAEYMWAAYVGALNKTLDVSQSELQNELSKKGKSARATEYGLKQVIFVVSSTTNQSDVENRLREAQGLRARFTDCESGTVLARGLSAVIVKDTITRSSNNLNEQMVELLNRTAPGHLTPPERTQNGIEMFAICSKKNLENDLNAGSELKNELLANRLDKESDRLYKELRAKAIITK